MKPQNMKQALERLEEIKENEKKSTVIKTLLERRSNESKREVIVRIYNAQGDNNYDNNGKYCVIDHDLLHDAVRKTAERLAAEEAKLKPVIYMAEAALRGVFSDQ